MPKQSAVTRSKSAKTTTTTKKHTKRGRETGPKSTIQTPREMAGDINISASLSGQ